jgi:hypothetical protein
MDIPIELPEGYYFNEVQGIIERIEDRKALKALQTQDNTFVMYTETPVDRGLVGHGMVSDDAGNIFGAIARADHDNPNIRWMDIVKCPAGQNAFDPTPIAERVIPFLKTDFPVLIRVGPDLLATVTDHAPQEAPRPSNVEGKWIRGVCYVAPPYVPPPQATKGPCVPPGNLNYARPNNTPTRGQLAKLLVVGLEASGFVFPPIAPGQRSFQDVPVGSTYYEPVEKLHSINAFGGYECDPNMKPA